MGYCDVTSDVEYHERAPRVLRHQLLNDGTGNKRFAESHLIRDKVSLRPVFILQSE